MSTELLNRLLSLQQHYEVSLTTHGARKSALITSRDYLVLCEVGDSNIIVGFDGMNDSRSKEKPLFWGRSLAVSRGFSGMHIYPLQNCWYQRGTLRKLFRKISETGFLEGFNRRVAVGGSMGGCGALWHAASLGCSDVLAFNPQVVLDEQIIAAGETRYREGWQMDWDRTRLPSALDGVKSILTVYDPRFAPDVAQLNVLRHVRSNITCLPIPFSGHSTPIFLSRTGRLSSLVDNFVRGTVGPELIFDVAQSRKMVGRYYSHMAAVARKLGRRVLAENLSNHLNNADVCDPKGGTDDYI